jgi:hypothetical protein
MLNKYTTFDKAIYKMKTNNNQDPVIVFAGSPVDAGMIQSMLEQEGIQAFVQDEFMSSIAPWLVEAGGSVAAKVVVASEDHEKALKLIEEYGISGQ